MKELACVGALNSSAGAEMCSCANSGRYKKLSPMPVLLAYPAIYICVHGLGHLIYPGMYYRGIKFVALIVVFINYNSYTFQFTGRCSNGLNLF